MPYYRNPSLNVFLKPKHEKGVYDEPVIVIPAAKWKDIADYCTGSMQPCKCEGDCPACEEDAKTKAIIAEVEAQNG